LANKKRRLPASQNVKEQEVIENQDIGYVNEYMKSNEYHIMIYKDSKAIKFKKMANPVL
jgi:hypothetical protein